MWAALLAQQSERLPDFVSALRRSAQQRRAAEERLERAQQIYRHALGTRLNVSSVPSTEAELLHHSLSLLQVSDENCAPVDSTVSAQKVMTALLQSQGSASGGGGSSSAAAMPGGGGASSVQELAKQLALGGRDGGAMASLLKQAFPQSSVQSALEAFPIRGSRPPTPYPALRLAQFPVHTELRT